MIPLDDVQKWQSSLDGQAIKYLSGTEHLDFLAIPAPERSRQLQALLTQPIAQFSAVNEVFFRARWAEVLGLLHPPAPLTLLEIASGDADCIPQMLARDFAGSRYLSANMNKILTARLRENTRGLAVEIQVIEEDAACIGRHLKPGSVDLIAFQHAVNDVLQAILCGREGIDTIEADWMAVLPAMIRILQRELAEDSFAAHVKAPWLSLLDQLAGVLKPGGLLVMNHYMFQLDLDWGYPPFLWENLIPIVRSWLPEPSQFTEISLAGFHPQWWMFLQKKP